MVDWMIRSDFNAALVFNCHYNGLNIIQELGRHGVPVYALDNTRSVGTVSRYAKFWRCADPFYEEDSFIEFLMEKGKSFKIPPVLIPTNDYWALAIAKNKRRLEKYYLPCIADFDTVDLLVSKDRFYDWAMGRGYPVPKMYTVEEALRLEADRFPIVFKPKYRRTPNATPDQDQLINSLDKYRMVMINEPGEIEDFIRRYPDLRPHTLLQEYVNGMADTMYTVGIYADRASEVKGVFTGRKVRGHPPDIGDCIVGQAELIPDELVALVKEIVKELHYHGIAEFEFKKDSITGDFKLIEINPRSWSWIGITPACGVSLPWIAYSDLTGREKVNYLASTVDKGDIKYIKLIQDMIYCLYLNKKKGFPAYSMNPGQWWASLNSRKKVYAEFSRDDPLVGVYSLFYLMKLFISAERRRVN